MNRPEQNTWRITQGKEPLKPVLEILQHFEQYVSTYKDQHSVETLPDDIIISDMLYGLGVALSEEYRFAIGFRKFKDRLVEQINEEGR